MRTRGADEDLVVVDLDDPDEVASRGPAAERHHFEDRYAELPFGLGTVPRRLDHTPWYTNPGAVLFIAIALIGLLALAGSGGRDDRDPAPAEPRAISPLGVQTGAHLALYHVGTWTELDVDRRTLRPIPPRALPAQLADLAAHASDLGVLPPRSATSGVSYQGRIVCLASTTGTPTARLALPGTCVPPEQPSADLGLRSASTRDGRFTFVASGPDLLVIDAIEDGFVRRVDMELPPFEAVFVLCSSSGSCPRP